MPVEISHQILPKVYKYFFCAGKSMLPMPLLVRKITKPISICGHQEVNLRKCNLRKYNKNERFIYRYSFFDVFYTFFLSIRGHKIPVTCFCILLLSSECSGVLQAQEKCRIPNAKRFTDEKWGIRRLELKYMPILQNM